MTSNMRYGDIPHFEPKREKLMASILLLLEEAEERGVKLSSGDIAKSLFIADDDHLAEHGRPVTFDNYVAMKKGPVGDMAIDLLKGILPWSAFGVEAAPWRTFVSRGLTRYVKLAVPANRRKLSRTDREALVAALEKVINSGFDKISDLTHNHPAWLVAWQGKADTDKAAPMDWSKFDTVDTDTIDDLIDHSRSYA